MQCAICEVQNEAPLFQGCEMMFGLRERFTYFQCPHCNCLQIGEFPADMTPYYPDSYYTVQNDNAGPATIPEWCHTMIGGPVIPSLYPPTFTEEEEIKFIKKAVLFYGNGLGLRRHSRILDVGCGRGSFLHALGKIGFTTLMGVDLFIKESFTNRGIFVKKGTIADVAPETTWDLIMFHHSLEHMPDQRATLQAVAGLLAEGGVCLIRIPIVSSYAWRHYGVNWVGLDAPRHFFLHSRQSMELLARQAGMQVQKIVYDSTSFQFWASEQYQRDIPLYSERSFAVSPSASIFSHTDLADFDRRSIELNKTGDGDFAAFYLRRPTEKEAQ